MKIVKRSRTLNYLLYRMYPAALAALLMISSPVMAQDDRQATEKQSVELPDFVITGVERITIQQSAKPKADLVPVLSQEFFKPNYSTEELQIAELSNPIKKDIRLLSDTPIPEGRLMLGAGIYTLPVGSFSYSKNLNNLIFRGRLYGLNERAYVDDAGYNASGLELSGGYFPEIATGFFRGLGITADGSYDREAYRFFASATPKLQRDAHRGKVQLAFNNLLDESLNYGLTFRDDIYYIKDKDLNENLYTGGLFLRSVLDKLELGGRIDYKSRGLTRKNSSADEDMFFLDAQAGISYRLAENLKVGAGLNLSKSDSSSFFAPTALIALKLDESISFTGSYNPHASYYAVQDLSAINRYYDPARTSAFVKSRNNIELAAKYEYQTYFELSAGISYASLEDYFYFTDTKIKGIFDLYRTDAEMVNAYLNVLFHQGPLGKLYGKFNIEQSETDNGMKLPYHPAFTGNMEYEYSFPAGLTAGVSFRFGTGSYADSLNKSKIPAFFDAGLSLRYEMMKNFEIFTQFSNIFDNRNYIWRDYREKPFDAMVGIEYRW